MLQNFHQLWNEINAFQRCKNYWNRNKIDVIMKMWKHENLKKIKNLRVWQNSRKLNYFANVFINQKTQFSKKKIELNFKFFLIFYIYAIFASQHMMNIEINQIMKSIKRFQTFQNWIKSMIWCKKYCTLKFFVHQIQRNEIFVFRFRRI